MLKQITSCPKSIQVIETLLKERRFKASEGNKI